MYFHFFAGVFATLFALMAIFTGIMIGNIIKVNKNKE